MSFPKQHEIYKRRFGRNVGLGLVLVCVVALIFGLTIAKVGENAVTTPTAQADN